MSRRQSCYIKYCASCENSTQPTAKKKIINSCFETPINSKITNRLLLLGAPAKKSREGTLIISETACFWNPNWLSVSFCGEGRWSMDIFWNYKVRLNIYNALKLSRKFRVNTLHIYGDRPPPSFFRVSFFFYLLTLDDSVLNLPRPSVKQCRYLFLKLTSLRCYFSTLKYPQFLLRLGT